VPSSGQYKVVWIPCITSSSTHDWDRSRVVPTARQCPEKAGHNRLNRFVVLQERTHLQRDSRLCASHRKSLSRCNDGRLETISSSASGDTPERWRSPVSQSLAAGVSAEPTFPPAERAADPGGNPNLERCVGAHLAIETLSDPRGAQQNPDALPIDASTGMS
jgi:hypothetical protein